jgi:hypothetical protein
MVAATPIQKGGNTMCINDSFTPRLGHARITHLRTNHRNGAIRLAPGYYRHSRRHSLPCEP